jgi:Tfp pilus tip-associated adhesin PilY1
MYVATTDGLLHAFGIDYNASDTYTFIGATHGTTAGTSGLQNEMWSFVPPAVEPSLMNAVGGGESVLLDGSPVVKDVVYQRTAVGSYEDWHTALVAGFGAASGGYYGLDVTDPDFTNRGTSPSVFAPIAHTGTNTEFPPDHSARPARSDPRAATSTSRWARISSGS